MAKAALMTVIAPGFLVLLLLLCPLLVYASICGVLREARFKRKLRSVGRTMSRHELRQQLENRHGTVIEEIGPKGPYRVWWTEDDLLRAEFEPPREDEVYKVLAGQVKSRFNNWCCKQYIDAEKGKARLTDVRPRKVLKLAREFPSMKTVPAIPWAARDEDEV